MLVSALGHAGLEVEVGAAKLWIDPWLSPEGAFQASWFPFPDNAHLVAELDFAGVDAVIVSHEHLDHLDSWVLGLLPASTPVLIPRYPSPILKEKLARAGDRPVVELGPWKHHEPAPGVTVFFVSEESPMNHDSAVVVAAGGHTLVDLNDARLFPMQLRGIRERVGGTVDVLALQGAGASWYPMCYRFDEERKARLSTQKRLAKLAYVARTIEVAQPGVALPIAGPPCFLDPELSRHNAEMDGGIFPDQRDVAHWLAQRGHHQTAVLLPGEAWDADALAKIAADRWDGFWEDDRGAYLEAYEERRGGEIEAVKALHPDPEQPLWDGFAAHFERLLGLSPYFNERIGMRVGFEVTGPGGGEWAVDFRPGHQEVSDHLGNCGYVYTFESRWLPPVLSGEVPWEDFFLSLRFEARRNPDVYNDHLLGLLKFAHPEPLEAVERYESEMDRQSRIRLESEGRQYSVGRFCPHAGSDLHETGLVLEGGVLQCLAHHYEFSLETGECLNGRCPGLSVDMVSGDEPSAVSDGASRG